MAQDSTKMTVAISADFLSAFANIPRAQQRKVVEFMTKFRENPRQASIHYEKIAQARDANLRSVRIDQNFRGIALAPEQGNVYVLLWVDKHDAAYRWALNKVCNIHPETGSLQIIPLDKDLPQQDPKEQQEQHQTGLFASLRDRNLSRLGIPEVQLPMVHNIKSEQDLDRVSCHFPAEASEALYMLAAGYSFEQVVRELEIPAQAAEIDTNDFAQALSKPDSLRRFVVVENEEELQEVISAPLEKWRVFLHPSQRKLVSVNWNGPTRVLGGAGTGKTVVAMHRAKYLASKVFTQDTDRILFTTFTRNLAADIRYNLKAICSDEAMKRIEVVNLDRWVSEFLRKHGYEHKVVYGNKLSELWQDALNVKPTDPELHNSFYREEWERVIQPQSVETIESYVKASRVGRGLRLNRRQRHAIWPVFEEYRALLDSHNYKEGVDAMRDARYLLERQGQVLPYRAVVVDEAQDMGMQAFKLIRAMFAHDDDKKNIFIVGDAHQRIYRHRVVLGQCGIDIRGRGRKLKVNYRTTEENRRWAVALLEGLTVDDLDGGQDEQKGYRSLTNGQEPKLLHFDNFQQEVDGIIDALGKKDLQASCLVTRSNKLLDQYEASLNAKDIQTYRIKRNEPEDTKAPGLRLATMHRVKGLEFDRVVIAACNAGIVPWEMEKSSDPVVKKETENQERSLLYVAATRAKKELIVSSFGQASRYLQKQV